jgi:hypothetical protein
VDASVAARTATYRAVPSIARDRVVSGSHEEWHARTTRQVRAARALAIVAALALLASVALAYERMQPFA